MKIKLISFGKLAFSLAMGAVLSACASANAAQVKMEVKVPGSIAGPNWVLVKQNAWPKYGGRVVYDPTAGCYVTDDVKRGETMRITVTPAAGESTAPNATGYGIWCASKAKYILWRNVTLPYVDSSYVVPLDTSLDNLYVDVWTNLSPYPFSHRIPIGPRVL